MIPKIRITEMPDMSRKVKFSLKLKQNIILGQELEVKTVFLMKKIKREKNFRETKMQNTGPSRDIIYYHCSVDILKNEEYQYFYKVNSDSEKEYRHYKFDPNSENKWDSWNQIWIGCRFNYEKQVVEQQLDLGNEIFKPQKQLKPVFLEQFQQVEDYNLLKMFEMKNNDDANNKSLIERLVLRSNQIIFEFSEEFIYDLLRNSVVKNQNVEIDFQKQLNEELKLQKEKFELHQQIYQNYTNNLNKVLEELILDTNQVSNEQIQHLLSPSESPQTIDPIFEKCKQSLIITKNKLNDLKQNEQRIQQQSNAQRIAYEQELQQLQNQHQISMSKNQNENQIFFQNQEKEIQHFKAYEAIQQFTKSLNKILEELIYDTYQISDEKISNLLTSIENPQIINSPNCQKFQQNLILIKNKLKDLTQNKQEIQNLFDGLKKAYEQEQQRSQNQLQNSTSLNLYENLDYLKYKDKESQINFLRLKFERHQQIYQTYTNNLNSILEELVLDTKYISDQQIQNLLTPIEIPQINDQIFEKCKQSLININNKLGDLKQNKSKIQEQYDALKEGYEQVIQELKDYEKIVQIKNEINYIIIKKLKQVLIEKLQEIEKLKKEQNLALIQYRIRIIDAKMKYYKDIEQIEQILISLIEMQKDYSIKLNLDTDRKIKLLEIEQARLKDLNKEKDSLFKTQSDYVTTLLIQIQNLQEKLKLQQN